MLDLDVDETTAVICTILPAIDQAAPLAEGSLLGLKRTVMDGEQAPQQPPSNTVGQNTKCNQRSA